MEQMPVFVKIDEDENIKDLIISLKHKLMESNKTIEKIRELSDRESTAVAESKLNMEYMDDKLEYVNSVLLEPEKL